MTEFENWLRKGLGRAAIFLQKIDSRPYREQLLYACTHDLTYDRQCEDRRGHYLLELIAASRDEAFYREAMLDMLKNCGEDLDSAQIFEIAGDYARKGDAAMKAAMYAAFESSGYANMGYCAAEQLVRLDGLEALSFVMKSFSEEEAPERPWQFRSLLTVLEERNGKQTLPPELLLYLAESEEEALRYRPYTPPTDEEISNAAGRALAGLQRGARRLRLDRGFIALRSRSKRNAPGRNGGTRLCRGQPTQGRRAGPSSRLRARPLLDVPPRSRQPPHPDRPSPSLDGGGVPLRRPIGNPKTRFLATIEITAFGGHGAFVPALRIFCM